MFIEMLWVISTSVSRGMVSVELGTLGGDSKDHKVDPQTIPEDALALGMLGRVREVKGSQLV